jgi:hypothetical protein
MRRQVDHVISLDRALRLAGLGFPFHRTINLHLACKGALTVHIHHPAEYVSNNSKVIVMKR